MTLGELGFIGLIVAVAIGYGVREYAMFIACHRSRAPVFPYPPDRLIRRLKLSLILILEAVVMAVLLLILSAGGHPFVALGLGTLVLFLLALLVRSALEDFKSTRQQYLKARETALLDVKEQKRAREAILSHVGRGEREEF
jgi:hypothetical protein